MAAVLKGLAGDLKSLFDAVETQPRSQSSRLRPSLSLPDDSANRLAPKEHPSKGFRRTIPNVGIRKSLPTVEAIESPKRLVVSRRIEEPGLPVLAELPKNAVLARLCYSTNAVLAICMDAYYFSENRMVTESIFSEHLEALETAWDVSLAPNSIDAETGASAIFFAAGSGGVVLVDFLLSRGFSVNSRDALLRTPLFWAAARGHLEICSLLLQAGAKVNARNAHGSTALHAAAFAGKVFVLELLMTRNDAIDIPGRGDRTALHVAVSRSEEGCVRSLLIAGADPTLTDSKGHHALHIAASKANMEICSLLVQSGQQLLQSKDRNGCTPLSLAIKLGHKDSKLLELLRGAPSNVSRTLNKLSPVIVGIRRDAIMIKLENDELSDWMKLEVLDLKTQCIRPAFFSIGNGMENESGTTFLWMPTSLLIPTRTYKFRRADRTGGWSKCVTVPSLVEQSIKRKALTPSLLISDHQSSYCKEFDMP